MALYKLYYLLTYLLTYLQLRVTEFAWAKNKQKIAVTTFIRLKKKHPVRGESNAGSTGKILETAKSLNMV